MPDSPGPMTQAVVRIAFDDAAGHHEVGSIIMLAIETDEQIEQVRRLVEYRVVDAELPSAPPIPIVIPDVDDGMSTAPSPPPPPIPLPDDIAPFVSASEPESTPIIEPDPTNGGATEPAVQPAGPGDPGHQPVDPDSLIVVPVTHPASPGRPD